jgi:GT2 family glycosyltransferase
LLPHAARNLGAENASGEFYLFTDPDIYPEPGWIEKLVAAYESNPGLIVGSIASFTTGLIDTANHLVKFDSWLPSGDTRLTEFAPTGNLLCAKTIYDRLGGFGSRYMLDDVIFSWKALKAGIKIWFEPQARVKHHHFESLKEMLKERWSRGCEFGYLRIKEKNTSAGSIQLIGRLLILPLRIVKLTLRVMVHALQAKMGLKFLMVWPLVALGESAWLTGEGTAYFKLLRQKEILYN